MLFYSRGYSAARGLFRGESFVLALFALLGMMVMIGAGRLITPPLTGPTSVEVTGAAPYPSLVPVTWKAMVEPASIV